MLCLISVFNTFKNPWKELLLTTKVKFYIKMLHFISFLFIFLSWVLILLSIKSIFNPFIYGTWHSSMWHKVASTGAERLSWFIWICCVIVISLKVSVLLCPSLSNPHPDTPLLCIQHLRTKWTMASGKIHTRPFLISITVTAWIIWTQEIWTSVWIPVIFIFYDWLAPLFSVNCVCAIYLKLLFKAIHK